MGKRSVFSLASVAEAQPCDCGTWQTRIALIPSSAKPHPPRRLLVFLFLPPLLTGSPAEGAGHLSPSSPSTRTPHPGLRALEEAIILPLARAFEKL
ncbi:hypothetical protein H920_10493 [Fukomys damarensis]|uniref:Uncharacterized protein n=1 Tax=Fukomys damarensis TaxID=885580 RepID=A0A091D7N0_FUKDA|nr:hypothetical protein H920_10493 [Fukomys damarensis]